MAKRTIRKVKAKNRKAVRTAKATAKARNAFMQPFASQKPGENRLWQQPFAIAKAWGKNASRQPVAFLQGSVKSVLGYFK